MINIYGLTIENLENYFSSLGENKAKAKIVYNAIYKERINDFCELSLSTRVIDRLNCDFEKLSCGLKFIRHENSVEAAKLLFGLDDGNMVESVLMRHDYGNSLCVSTQVGCNMGCAFCESGPPTKKGRARNLKPHEIVLQILKTEAALSEKVSRVTLMGIGEPLDNFDNVMDFIDIIGESQGLSFAPRHITISTCGLVERIEQLAQIKTHNNLAISLNAPTDELRNAIMPINKTHGIKELIRATKAYSDKKNKKTTIEYIMLEGFNDSNECAHALCRLLDGIKCYVNLIPYNQTALGFKRSSPETIAQFQKILSQNGIKTTIRREFGKDIKAACGQLRAKNGGIL
ncbi:MAG: 23S rRNA (adenine(2503)-C(2))-methyltransferase RlmN [Oscillospiraceae bacterium]|nr:23S rRNA (adenine(2503)-C(2))-methyltransferase RlmN [Oscillospiraceae bacterium]